MGTLANIYLHFSYIPPKLVYRTVPGAMWSYLSFKVKPSQTNQPPCAKVPKELSEWSSTLLEVLSCFCGFFNIQDTGIVYKNPPVFWTYIAIWGSKEKSVPSLVTETSGSLSIVVKSGIGFSHRQEIFGQTKPSECYTNCLLNSHE